MVFYVFVVSVLFGLYLLPLYVLWFFMYTCMYAYNYVHVHSLFYMCNIHR